MNNQDIELKKQDIELKTNTPQPDTMFILDQLDLLDQSESVDTVEFTDVNTPTNNTNIDIAELDYDEDEKDNVKENVDENGQEDEKEDGQEDVRVLAYLQCKSLESYTHTELDKHLKKQHNVVFDKGGYINLYTKMFLAECKTCGAGWNMYSVDPPSAANFNVDALGKISHVTPYKGYSVHSNLHKTVQSENDPKKGWDKWWDRNSGLQDKINYHPQYTQNTIVSTKPTVSDPSKQVKVI